MRLLFLFLDGVGLGTADAERNPFVASQMPVLESLLAGQKLTIQTLRKNGMRLESERATLLALDPALGVAGLPQSATGQAALLTGKNVPAIIGQHYGPKPTPEIAAILENGNLFAILKHRGKKTALLNAFPEGYFETIQSGKRLPGAIAMAAIKAGIPLKNKRDLLAGQAISADFTAQGWRDHLKMPDTPLLSPKEAGSLLARLGQQYDFSIFEYWLSDVAGHRRDMETACQLLETFDAALGGLLDDWDDEAGLILLTSDHGNLEDLESRRHTHHPVPALLIGSKQNRALFATQLNDLSDVYGSILEFLAQPSK